MWLTQKFSTVSVKKLFWDSATMPLLSDSASMVLKIVFSIFVSIFGFATNRSLPPELSQEYPSYSLTSVWISASQPLPPSHTVRCAWQNLHKMLTIKIGSSHKETEAKAKTAIAGAIAITFKGGQSLVSHFILYSKPIPAIGLGWPIFTKFVNILPHSYFNFFLSESSGDQCR